MTDWLKGDSIEITTPMKQEQRDESQESQRGDESHDDNIQAASQATVQSSASGKRGSKKKKDDGKLSRSTVVNMIRDQIRQGGIVPQNVADYIADCDSRNTKNGGGRADKGNVITQSWDSPWFSALKVV